MTMVLRKPARTQREIYRAVLAKDFASFVMKVFETLHPGVNRRAILTL